MNLVNDDGVDAGVVEFENYMPGRDIPVVAYRFHVVTKRQVLFKLNRSHCPPGILEIGKNIKRFSRVPRARLKEELRNEPPFDVPGP